MGSAVLTSLHPSLDRALRLAEDLAPEPAAAAGAVLEEVLAPLAGSPLGETAWSGSRLSRTGFPVELAFVAGDPSQQSLRWTAEVTGPEVPAGERLGVAVELYERLAGAALPDALDAFLRQAQTDGTLQYGAWLGGRHRPGQSTFKLYAEVLSEAAEATGLAAAWERDTVGAPPVLLHRGAQLCMVGYHADAGRLELYFEGDGLLTTDVATAMARVGLEARAHEVLDLFQQAHGRTFRLELPCRKAGWSYSLSTRGEAPAFTFYTFANSLMGGDGRIREALLRLCAAHGWRLPLYEAVSRPLAGRRGFLTCHGLFGVVVADGAPATICVGLVPPGEAEA